MQSLRAAMVGFGSMGEGGHLPAYLTAMGVGEPFELVAIADVCAARRELARRLVPTARVYADHEAMLAAEATLLDFVDIAAPPCDHAAIAEAAIEHGLHVLCEKPIASSGYAAKRLLARARRAGRVVFPSHSYKHAPIAKAIRRMLDEDRIGDVRLVTMQTFCDTHARGVRDWRPDWRRERAIAGGGIAVDHGSQSFYLAFDWMNAYPHAVSATISTSSGADTEDSVASTLRFPGNRLASVHLTWTGGMRRVLYTIHGTAGAIRVEDDDIEVVTRLDSSDGLVRWRTESAFIASPPMDASHPTWFRSVLDDLASAIARRDFMSTDTEDALRCIDVIDATYRSARDGAHEVPLTVGEPLVRPLPLVDRVFA